MNRRQPPLLPGDVGVTRYLPWIVAILTYLAVLAASGGLVALRAVDAWSADLRSVLTVEVGGARDSLDDRAEALAEALSRSGLADSVRVVPRAEVAQMLQPWLGSDAVIATLPLPALIDVRLAEPDLATVERVRALVAAQEEAASLDDHGVWLSQLGRLARAAQVLSLAVVLLVGLATTIAIVFGTRAALAAHHDIVELVHIMGARDGAIAGRFQWQAVWMALRGGFAGLALAVMTLFGLTYGMGPMLGTVFGDMPLHAEDLLAVSVLPLLAGLVAAVTARWTVLRDLRGMY